MKYELEWQYVDDPDFETAPYLHFIFMLRFPDVPPGKGHVAHFCFNVLENPQITAPGTTVLRRGFLNAVPFSKQDVLTFVETTVEQISTAPRERALARLNELFINEDIDFSKEFIGDLIERDDLVQMIERAFDSVKREDGITLHQAVVLDEYGTEAEFIAAKKQDTELRWQDVPEKDLAANPYIFNFLDPNGFKYYIPAAMTRAVKNHADDEFDQSFYTYLAVLPTIAPRDIGRGMGKAFDLDGFIQTHAFTPTQVIAIYHFICFMAIRAGYEINEDQFEAVSKWRDAAAIHTTPRS